MKSRNFNFELLVLCFSFFFTLSSHGQLFVDAGNDTTFCAGPYFSDTIFIGKNVKIENAIEPYSIAWECKVPLGLSFLTAKDILSDTTIISPYIETGPTIADSINFILHVTDSEGNYANDSIIVHFSFYGILLGYQVIYLNQGDSVWFNGGTIGGKYDSIYWRPREGLSDPDSVSTWCKPDTTTDYFQVTVDKFGCKCMRFVYEIRVVLTKTDDFKINPNNSLNLIQKGPKVYFDNMVGKEALISLFSLNGVLLHKSRTNSNSFEVSRLLHKRGIYIVKISIGGNIGICKFLK
ncbi:hypothetical protein MNBD_BACTEROID01-1340 [hydrothermal vent metagenome]|uniref:Secretion system C-terminal sorting domain-containing protein n=1 Tax=hydrothermal vent metagenome TaxID=652676 RepID=A0A3B0TB39_9ZZZZ